MPDTVENILDEIDSQLLAIRSSLRESEQRVQQASAAVDELLRLMLNPFNAVWKQRARTHELQIAAVSRTQDIEWVLSYQYARRKFQASFRPRPINESQGGISFSLTPIGTPSVSWASTSAEPVPAGRIEIRLRWRLESTVTADPEYFDHKFQIRPKLDGTNVRFVECTTSDFAEQGDDRKDLLWMLPVQYRRQGRARLYQEVGKMISSLSLPLPPLDVLGSSPVPHSITIWGHQLLLAGRGLPKRRQSYPLASRMSFRSDAGVRIKKDHVETIIKDKVESQDVSLVRQEFHYGYIVTEVHRHEQHKECWVTVDVDVWLVHEHVFREATPGVLHVHSSPHGEGSNNSWGRYEIKASNCWPACDRVIREAESRTVDAINDAQHVNLEFADLSAICRRASCVPATYGLYFMLEI